jgi:hypothetical protein
MLPAPVSPHFSRPARNAHSVLIRQPSGSVSVWSKKNALQFSNFQQLTSWNTPKAYETLAQGSSGRGHFKAISGHLPVQAIKVDV